MMLPSFIPAVVDSYDQATRMCRVRIDGITDGADILPLAEILYPIGDKSQHTELEILAGDLVWVAFQFGDPRYPIVTGSRAKNVGNALDWRRYHHANIELSADGTLILRADKVQVIGATSVEVTAPNITETGILEVNGNTSIYGNIALDNGSLTHKGKNVGDTHKHSGVASGGSQTGNPV